MSTQPSQDSEPHYIQTTRVEEPNEHVRKNFIRFGCSATAPLVEATLVVAMVMQRYRLDLMPGQTVKAQHKVTLRPGSGV